MDHKAIVIKAFADSKEPLKGGEIAELTGLDKKEVDKIINQLKKEEAIFSPKRCYYELKQ